MMGKTVVITGASSGIGAVAARRLAECGANVIPVGRSPRATAAVAADIGTEPLTADYARLGDVRDLAKLLLQRCPAIDVLVHNAGGMPANRQVTEDGYELTMQVNYLAPFLLQHLLHDRLSANGAHVVVTSSVGHRVGHLDLDDLGLVRRSHSTSSAYYASKLADLLFAREIARRTPRTGITAVSLHPGAVDSGFGREATGILKLMFHTSLGRRFLNDEEHGAAPLVHLASLACPRGVNGQYFNQLKPDAPTSRRARDAKFGRELWSRTERLLDLFTV